MSVITYIKPTLRDIPAMQQLVEPEIESGVILPRSDDEIATNIRSYFLAMDGDKLVGFVALHIHSPSLAELRSMIIDTQYRGMNIGSTLVENACAEGRLLGLKEVLALTYQQRFFERLGFIEIPKETIPEHKIWADCIKCKHFPVCNEVSLIKTL
ncbi:N-acetyltransferase [Sulfuricurvum sp.]|uniref:N-acetyltransferase n=1 Tax=Sulfuricurvum sp. TaxID=2025608 RepID=UPI002614A5F2|nr:N-acetyltransferase [Sulfuricurvum sp.]MDD2267341.1 N-acetyltransferase [Sulfuricurvum sp.]MDD2784322.1 N-acetyltransferase [Sulfuricurvum sp.]